MDGHFIFMKEYIDGLAQDCSNSIANALELRTVVLGLSCQYVIIDKSFLF